MCTDCTTTDRPFPFFAVKSELALNLCRPLLVLHHTFQLATRRLRGLSFVPGLAKSEICSSKLCKEFWRIRWAERSAALDADQKIALCECLRSKVESRPAEKLDASVVQETLADWSAATRIQASFRGWQWRKAELFNPNHEIGRRHLQQIAVKACQQGVN